MPQNQYEKYLGVRRKSDALRRPRTVEPLDSRRATINGRELLNFSSNDYLGLAGHPELISRACAYAKKWGAGSRASRLICGNITPIEMIEGKIAAGKQSESALIFASGFQANASVLPALLDSRVLGEAPLVFSDRLNHASIHHGCKTAGARQIRYNHLDLDHLEKLLKKHSAQSAPSFILAESVFSMDGDMSDIAGLIDLKERFNAFLFIDEAHSTGVFGKNGFGFSADFPGKIDLAMGTFSKALGGFGAYVACSETLKDYLVNRADGFIYSTALPPPVLGAMDAALDLLPSMEGERRKLLKNSQKTRDAFCEAGLDVCRSSTQIIPVVLGSEKAALYASSALEEQGVLATAIRPPTVPKGSSRIRFSLSAAHTEADVDFLIDCVLRTVPPLVEKS